MQNIDLGGGLVETDAPKFKVCKGKGTTTVTLDFDDSNDDVFDEEVENAWASRLTESTIDVNTGEKVACQLEKGVSTDDFFPDPSSKETTVDIGKMKDVAQEPATPAEALETIPGGVDFEAYMRCMEYCQAQGVNLDTFKFVGIILDKLHIMPRKLELKLSKYINDAFIVPDADEAQLARKSSLELADASVTMIYKNGLLQRSVRKSLEEDVKNAALHEKSLLEEIKSLKSQLAAKEKERVETVEALHNMESRCISVEAKLETKIEDLDNLKKDFDKIVKEKNYLKKLVLCHC
ncbi:unnamed protein product [Miscanthus lutarioriparius]|uniref:Uncharacterized protein n=1 Tax=Miscanthus lutarioriparius TaxID=422564 RepID=A0A811MZ14_9POAL|nr:unnamed protein product [Miscanthus lutarioriparius]